MANQQPSNKPTHSVSIKTGDENNPFEKIGVAWMNEEGKVTVKLSGKQIVDAPLYLNWIPNKTEG